jgi:hypothetical protein
MDVNVKQGAASWLQTLVYAAMKSSSHGAVCVIGDYMEV